MKAARFKAEQPGWKRAFTLPELLVVLALLLITAALLLPALVRPHDGMKTNCVNNLKQVGLAFRIFSGDNNDKFPMQVPVSEGGVLGLLPQVSASAIFRTMTNELGATKIVLCPEDKERSTTQSQNFDSQFTDRNVSYFVGLEADETNPTMLLAGDRNLTNGSPALNGVLTLSTNANVGWTHQIHTNVGNIGLADGSVWQTTPKKLRELVRNSRATNGVLRLAIP